jgi:hypothetical protein
MDTYLIWSNHHGAWWRGPFGYTPHLSEAGRFARDHALALCTDAIPGEASRSGMLPELPVRLDDVRALQQAYHARHPISPVEVWEAPPDAASPVTAA